MALKGIIGIGAMAQIADLTGNTADAANYTSTSRNYINRWYNLSKATGAKPAHRTLAYGDDSTYSELAPQRLFSLQPLTKARQACSTTSMGTPS